MSDNIADVFVHINETLPLNELEALESDVHDLEGVVSVSGRDDKPHLIMVAYRPEHIGSLDIVNKIKSGGLHAQLIGL